MLTATLVGNIGNDGDMRYTANGDPLLRFNVASNSRRRNAEGAYEDETTWVRITITGKRAESLAPYMKKGTRVTVLGRLDARPWTDQQGNLRAGLEMLCNEIDFSTPRDGNGQPPIQAQIDQQQRQQPAASGGVTTNGNPPPLPWE